MTPTYFELLVLVMLAPLAAVQMACDDPTDALQGQHNTTITFYGRAVDQDDRALPGVRFVYRLEAYPKDWTFDTRGRNNDAWTLNAESDKIGDFQLTMTGCKLVLLKVEPPPGYRQFSEMDTGDYDGHKGDNQFYSLISWGQVMYKSDPDRPAVFVFVKDGVREVSALPSRGGYYAYGKEWRPNEPAWPRKPSLTDVVQKSPATQP